jgi:hypothetical protein
MNPLESVRGRVHALALMIAIACQAVWALDHLTTREDPTGAPPAGDAPRHPGSARVLLLLVDSLRWETATDPAAMPHLVALSERATIARVRTSTDAVTVSAVREMFTGRERFLAFGFLRDFVTGRESVESLFTQMKAAGIRADIHPPDAFVQFGDDLPAQTASAPVDDRNQGQQDAWVREALDKLREGRCELCIGHIVYTDRVAHDVGVYGAEYAEAYRHVDSLVDELDRSVPEDVTLVVAGDHGHTDSGRHSLGLDVPTFLLYRGPAFQSGVSLGTIPITAHRYLLGWALELPLAADYSGSRHPEALRAEGPRPPEYAVATEGGAPRSRASPWFAIVAMGTGALAATWLSWLFAGLHRGLALAWLGVLAGAGVVWWAPLSIAPLAGAVAAVLVGARERAAAVAVVGGAAVGFLLHRWGVELGAMRALIHEPSWETMERVAVAVVLGAAALAAWLGAVRASWIVTGAVMLLLPPTVYRYGAMPALVTLWLAWLVALFADTRRNALHPLPIGCAFAAVLFLQPFGFADAGNFTHESWHPWASGLMPHGTEAWTAASLVAKLVIFVRLRGPRGVQPLGLVAAWALHQVHWGFWDPTPAEHVAAIGVLTLVGALARRHLDGAAGHEVRRVAWLSALYLVYYYAIRIPHDHYMWADFFFAALKLSAVLAHRFGRNVAGHAAILMVFGAVAAGWVTLAWTLHLLEWSVLYDGFPASVVEEHALLFMPVILGRYVAIVAIARLILGDVFGASFPRRPVLAAFGLKALGLAATMTGLGLALPDTGVYLEAVQEIAIVLVLAAGAL